MTSPLTIQKPEPPEARLVDALASEQAAKAGDLSRRRSATPRCRTELESIKDLVGVLGPQGAILWKAIQDGKVEGHPRAAERQHRTSRRGAASSRSPDLDRAEQLLGRPRHRVHRPLERLGVVRGRVRNPDTLRTYCSAAARTSCSVTRR